MYFSLPNTAPTDRVEKLTVDHPTARTKPAGLVFINIVERRAGIEARSHARPDAVGKETAKPDRGPRQSPIEPTWRGDRQRRCQAVGFVAAITGNMRLPEIGDNWRLVETCCDECTDFVQCLCPIPLAQCIVIKT